MKFRYTHPDKLNPKNIDPAICDLVIEINKTGWIYTEESCQGAHHPDQQDFYLSNLIKYLTGGDLTWEGDMGRLYLKLVLRDTSDTHRLYKLFSLVNDLIWIGYPALLIFDNYEVVEDPLTTHWTLLVDYHRDPKELEDVVGIIKLALLL